MSKQHVAIIGGGASGLVTLKELREEGHTGIIFERSSHVGGIFKTVYQEGQMVSSTIITMFSDFLGSEGERILTHPRMLTFELKLPTKLRLSAFMIIRIRSV
ncbi:unnamed protein product [Rotaria socialis]